jgi:hypothetical protein
VKCPYPGGGSGSAGPCPSGRAGEPGRTARRQARRSDHLPTMPSQHPCPLDDLAGQLRPVPCEAIGRGTGITRIVSLGVKTPPIRGFLTPNQGPRDGPRGPRGLHRSQGGDNATVSTPEAGAGLSPAPAFALLQGRLGAP